MSEAIFLVSGYKNSGKTTLVCKLIRLLREQGRTVGTIKHDAHDFELDLEGKDTWQHRQAGAEAVAITSDQGGRTFIMEQRSLELAELIARLSHLDVVVAEGFKHADYPKIVIVREEAHLPLLSQVRQAAVIATWLPSETVEPHASGVPVVSIDRTEELLELVMEKAKEHAAAGPSSASNSRTSQPSTGGDTHA
ncbi:molybdopterin-guanine dinucleotide biosynthesis protein B [Paenibacillus sp. YYML68]|uniref:molybdopterin-guanine dinucleotide biosynthesis protein B n=1 Tax=Paenibacillus sp. YYML68 TaxID=2909250 RepID=UPI002493CA17|nr:molybdopterin-guanine dinucleotide biosynthesis protein B [Paenibacillus sp. YYML68]